MKQSINFNQFIKQRPAFVAFILTLLLHATVIAFCDLRYETNDDLFMNGIVSGFFGGIPDSHLPYSHFLIGLLLSKLYTWSTALNWYALYLIGTHVISWFLIFWVIAKKSQPFFPLAFTVGLFIATEPLFYSLLQFTTTATLAGIAGMTLLHEAFSNKKRNNKLLLAGIAMVLYAALIRESSAFLAILLCSIPFADFQHFRRMFQPALLVISLFIGIASLQYINRLYFENESGWSAYYHGVKSGNRFNDNPAFYDEVVNAGKDLKPINGWSSNDLMLFAALFRSYEPVYNLPAYEKLYGQYTSFRPIALRDFIYAFRTRFGLPFVIVLLIFCLYYSEAKGRAKILLQCALMALLAWYIYATLQMKERALLSMLFSFCISLLLIRDKAVIPTGSQRLIAMILLSTFLLGGTVYQFGKRKNAFVKTSTERNLTLGLLEMMQKEKATWMVWGPALPMESLSPFKHSFTYKNRQPDIYPVSIFNKSPLFEKAYGKTMEAVLADPTSRILSINEPWVTFTPERLDTFYRTHLGCILEKEGDSIDAGSGRRIFWFKGCKPIQAP